MKEKELEIGDYVTICGYNQVIYKIIDVLYSLKIVYAQEVKSKMYYNIPSPELLTHHITIMKFKKGN